MDMDDLKIIIDKALEISQPDDDNIDQYNLWEHPFNKILSQDNLE